MRTLKNHFLLAAIGGIFIFSSCKKDNTSGSGSVSPDECVTGRGANDGNVIQGQFIVTLKGASQGDSRVSQDGWARNSQRFLEARKIRSASVKSIFGGSIRGFVARLNDQEVSQLRNDDSVQVVEQDRIIALGKCFTVVEPRLITWSVARVGYGDGTGKTAWIIDSGIDIDHPDLNVDQVRSRCFINGETSFDDQHGHGTHVAGIIGAKNNNIGLLGVASGASVVSLKVLGANGEGTLSSVIQALAYVNTNGKPGDVVNMSLGEELVSPTLDQQVLNTSNRGIFIAMAAGNDNKAANNFSPGRVNGPNLFTVSAVDSLDNFASFSNFGNDVVDYAAPGVKIISTYTDGRYAMLSGTSMAAPHVAGLLLLKGKNITKSGTAKNDPDGSPDGIAHF